MLSFLYLIASICFIFALKGLSSPKSARFGNMLGMLGMIIAITATYFHPTISGNLLISLGIGIGAVIGIYIATHISITNMPQLIAAFHSLVGLGVVVVVCSAILSPESFYISHVGQIPLPNRIEIGLSVMIGAITLTGSLTAFAKLQGIISHTQGRLPAHLIIFLGVSLITLLCVIGFCQTSSLGFFLLIIFFSLLLGLILILPIGGAEMPIMISMLNSYSGWSISGIGFTLNQHHLIMTGALIGASGVMLSYLMCKKMNRSLWHVLFGNFASEPSLLPHLQEERAVKAGSPEDAAFLMKNAHSIIIIPGYGMAVAQAHHALKEMVTQLEKHQVAVKYAIHPVAGRMPGHMNVLLAEANVSYEQVFALEDINRDFITSDIAFVIGANDVTNPAAKNDPSSPLYGMPILEAGMARTVIFVKRSMNTGYAGIENELFYQDNTMMLFGDAKHVTEAIIKALNIV